jgi:uncharacterized lipoprotein YddW (UPF0748 family)
VSPALRSTDVKFLSARATAVGAAIVSVAALGAARDYPGSPDELRTASVRVTPGLSACPLVPMRPAADAVADTLAPPAVAREFRAAWISPVDGGEWPSVPDLDEATQQAELRRILDRAAAIGLNALILHVRPAADALYPTDRAPWSSYLRSRGDEPGYDPLAFALAEAHRRGLQLHVWMNPFRAAPPEGRRAALGAARLRATRAEWVVRYGSQQWIDPGDPGARQAVLNAMLEVVYRYDVDAIHLDDYFYPYLEERTTARQVRVGRRVRTVRTTETIPFPDGRSWEQYGAGAGWRDRGDWRRENVSSFVHALYDSVKAHKPWVAVGISPFGIWRPGSPRGVTGLDAYTEIFADSRRWWREGWLDYLTPQLYWHSDGEQLRNQRLDAWWRSENVRRRHLWPGMLTMRVASGANRWPATEIERQIGALRSARAGSGETQGHVHFRMKSLLASAPGGLGDRLAATMYATPALPPASPWLGADEPGVPQIAGCADGAAPVAALTPVGPGRTRWWFVQWRDAAGRWTGRTLPAASSTVPLAYGDGSRPTAVAVRAISPTGVEGQPLVLAPPVP